MILNLRPKTVFFTAVLILLSLTVPQPLKAEYVFMKDGRILEGTVVSDSRSTVTLRTPDKKRIKIPRSDILRILYTSLNMGKVYIQKRDGKGLEAFVVDEDRDSYTFRKDLHKPAEFSLKRKEILFIAEKNPSGLGGKTETDRVHLTWQPPYNKVKYYTVYLKASEAAKYQQAGRSKGLSLTVKDLKSNSVYWLIVKATDEDGYESLPSNEIKITTGNILPGTPLLLSAKKERIPRDKTIVTRVRWEASTDPDGKVVKYRLYATRDGKRTMIAETMKTEYELKGVPAYQKLELAAVDDRGGESPTRGISASFGSSGYTVAVNGALILPVGRLAYLFKMGYGVTASFTAANELFEGFEPGIEAGYYRFTSAHYDVDGADRDVEGGYMTPVMMRLGYRFGPTGTFT